MRTYTGKYDQGGRIQPVHMIDASPYPSQRIYFELDDGSELVVRNMGTHIEVKATGVSDDLGKGAIHVLPATANKVHVKPGEWA